MRENYGGKGARFLSVGFRTAIFSQGLFTIALDGLSEEGVLVVYKVTTVTGSID